MGDDANGWFMDASMDAVHSADYSNASASRPAQRPKRTAPEPARPPPAPAPAPAPPPAAEANASSGDAGGGDSSTGMSNKTLDLMLGRLQGQLPVPTYDKVIALVRDVQNRRLCLSRTEFLEHFQAICAGTPKPRG